MPRKPGQNTPPRDEAKYFQLRLTPELHKQLKTKAAQRETTITELLIEAARALVDAPEQGSKGGACFA